MIWQYPGLTLRWHFSQFNHHGYEFANSARALGVYVHGLNGTLRANYGMHEILSQVDGLDPAVEPKQCVPAGTIHEIEWLECIRTGGQPNCSPEDHIKVDRGRRGRRAARDPGVPRPMEVPKGIPESGLS